MKCAIRFLSGCFVLLLTLNAIPLSAQHSPPDEAHTPPTFIRDSLVRSYALVSAAERAREESRSQEVKGYAQRINEEYDNLISQLHDLAEDKNIPLDKDELNDLADDLMFSVTDQQAFDVAYGRNQVPAIWQIINLFQAATEFEDKDISQFATQSLPQIRRHLQLAEQLFSATTETKTDIYQNRDNQIDTEGNRRIPTTERINPSSN